MLVASSRRQPVRAMFDFKNASAKERQQEYKRIAVDSGDDRFFTARELNHLPRILMDGEQVLAFSSGLMDGNTWLIVLTDKRVIFLDKGLLYGLRQVSVDLDRINSVASNTGLLFGDILITDGARQRKIEDVAKRSVGIFTNKVQEAIDARKIYLRPGRAQQVERDEVRAKVVPAPAIVEPPPSAPVTTTVAPAHDAALDADSTSTGCAAIVALVGLGMLVYTIFRWVF
jgi:hypothetical protein